MCRWMISLPGYEVTQLLASTDGVHYYEGRQSDGKKVIIHHFKSFSVESEKREWKAFPSFIEPMEIKKLMIIFSQSTNISPLKNRYPL